MPYDAPYTWNPNYDTNQCICKTDSQTQKTTLWLPKGERGGGIHEEFGMSRHTLPWWLRRQKICLQCRRSGLISGSGRSPGGGDGFPVRYSCLENPHGQRSLVGYSPWGRRESETTERLTVSLAWCELRVHTLLYIK